jgi:hypothetical protein
VILRIRVSFLEQVVVSHVKLNTQSTFLVVVMAFSPSTSTGDDTSKIDPASQLEAEELEAKYNNFYTPSNRTFYNNFQYATLNPSDRRVRLLHIHPHGADEDDNATIKCDLIDDVSLEEYAGKFTTISYCAGDPNNTEIVLVNGVRFNAFANLSHALRQARHFWKTHHADRQLLLWADQICIDQSNTPERSHQVGFMGDIYAAAQQVLICLSTKEDRGKGMTWLKQFWSDVWTHHGQRYFDYYKKPEIFELNEPISPDEDLQLGFQSFRRTILGSPWWSRAWVRQELMRSHNAYFLASYESLSFQSLAIVMQKHWWHDGSYRGHHTMIQSKPCQICVAGELFLETAPLVRTASNILQMKARIGSSLSTFPDLLDNLKGVPYCNASDSRDLIYAALGYSSNSYGIEPDYTQGISLCDVSCQLACKIVDHYDNFHVLELALHTHHDASQKKDVEFPSWVPDWRCFDGTSIYEYRALQVRQSVSFSSDDKGRSNRVLHARGIRLGAENTPISVRREEINASPSGNSGLEEDDEVWLLHGASDIYRFRRKGQYHELTGRGHLLYGSNYTIEWIDEVAALVIDDHPCIQTIQIC